MDRSSVPSEMYGPSTTVVPSTMTSSDSVTGLSVDPSGLPSVFTPIMPHLAPLNLLPQQPSTEPPPFPSHSYCNE